MQKHGLSDAVDVTVCAVPQQHRVYCASPCSIGQQGCIRKRMLVWPVCFARKLTACKGLRSDLHESLIQCSSRGSALTGGCTCRSVANWGAADSMRGSMEGSHSSMSSHMPSGMTGLPSVLQGMPAAYWSNLRVRAPVQHWQHVPAISITASAFPCVCLAIAHGLRY